MLKRILRKFHYVPESECTHKELLASLEINRLKRKEEELQSKELILYMVSELLHNKKDRTETFTNNEVSTILSKARVFTPYYGPEHPDLNAMDHFIEYLANDAWVKVFGKPARETDIKVSEKLTK
jgi:5-methylthioribose kinase